MTENEISYLIRGAIFKVYKILGAGLLESVYVAALTSELTSMGLKTELEVPIKAHYENVKLPIGFRMDLLIEDKVIIEVKSVELLMDVHHKQLLTYLKMSGLKLGLLINFNVADMSKGIIRKVNGL